MKRFLAKSALFLTILITINFIFYIADWKVYFSDYSNYSLKYKSYLISDSHGIPLKNFTEKYGVFNFSANGDSYDDMYRKIVFLVNHTHVDTIYITAGDHTLSSYRETANNMDRSVIYSSPDEFSSNFEFVKEKYLRHFLALSQQKANTVLKGFLISKIENWIKPKKGNLTKDWKALSDSERAINSDIRVKSQFLSDKPSVKLQHTLIDIINYCQHNKIELIGIKFPLTAEYIRSKNQQTYKADELLKSYHIKVLNFTNVFLSNKEYFSNQDHLNELGGEKFTEILLANDCKLATKL